MIAFSIDANAVIMIDRQLVVVLAQLVEHLQAVEARHHHVDDDRVERQRAGEVEPFAAVRGQPDAVALADEQRLENLAHDFLVVDDEDGSIAAHECSSRQRAARGRLRRPRP